MNDVDVVGRFCAAMEVGDLDAVIGTLHPDAELVSPLIGRAVFRGHEDLRVLIAALLSVLSGLTWRHRVGDAGTAVAVADARVLGVRIADAMLIEYRDGRIQRLTPHIRPWAGATALALALGPKLIRHPGVLARAIRPADLMAA